MFKAVKRKLANKNETKQQQQQQQPGSSQDSDNSQSHHAASGHPGANTGGRVTNGVDSAARTNAENPPKPMSRPNVLISSQTATLPASPAKRPHRRNRRRRSSIVRENATSELQQLAMLDDTAVQEHASLFRLKLELCKVRFNFDNPSSNLTGKELKRKTLLELVEYINTERGRKIFSVENMMEDIVSMVSVNIFRALAPQEDEFDPEEDEPVLESAWPHLQVVYEFLLRFVVSKEVNSKVAKRKGVIDQKFCLKLVQMFDSEDPRERDYLKTILHRVYGKFMSHRSFIRKQISYTFQRFVYETERHNGVSELLEILGSIINGFALPLKEEHQLFLKNSLIPLHKPKCVSLYHQQLNYCIVQYVEKDHLTAVPIVNGLYKFWPWTHSSKQVMILNELEEVLEEVLDTVAPDCVDAIRPSLLRIISKCINSEHFQVVERTLYLWNNDKIVTHCFANQQAKYVLPAIFKPLCSKLDQHWNPTVMNLAKEVAQLYKLVDANLWNHLEENRQAEEQAEQQNADKRRQIWMQLSSKEVRPSELDFSIFNKSEGESNHVGKSSAKDMESIPLPHSD